MADGIIQEGFKKQEEYLRDRIIQVERYSSDFKCKQIIKQYIESIIEDARVRHQELIEKIKQATIYHKEHRCDCLETIIGDNQG